MILNHLNIIIITFLKPNYKISIDEYEKIKNVCEFDKSLVVDDYLNIGCYNCVNCFICVNCINCINCVNCINCKKCYLLFECQNKLNLKGCKINGKNNFITHQ